MGINMTRRTSVGARPRSPLCISLFPGAQGFHGAQVPRHYVSPLPLTPPYLPPLSRPSTPLSSRPGPLLLLGRTTTKEEKKNSRCPTLVSTIKMSLTLSFGDPRVTLHSSVVCPGKYVGHRCRSCDGRRYPTPPVTPPLEGLSPSLFYTSPTRCWEPRLSPLSLGTS